MKEIDAKINRFVRAVQQLSSSVSLILSANRLRARFEQLFLIFRNNASKLFDLPEEPRGVGRRAATKTGVPVEAEPIGLPEQLSLVAQDLVIFLEVMSKSPSFQESTLKTERRQALNRIPEFSDEVRMHVSIDFKDVLTEIFSKGFQRIDGRFP